MASRQRVPPCILGMRHLAGRSEAYRRCSSPRPAAWSDAAIRSTARCPDPRAPRARSKCEVPGHQDRQQIVPLRRIRQPHPRDTGQLPLRQCLQCRQTGPGGNGAGSPRRRRLRRHGACGGYSGLRRCGGEGRPQRRNPGLGRGPCFAKQGIRTAQPFPRPCSAVPPACAADVPTRCASRAGGCRCAAVRPPVRCRARRHCGAAAPAAPPLRG